VALLLPPPLPLSLPPLPASQCLLESLVGAWEDHKLKMTMLKDILMYMVGRPARNKIEQDDGRGGGNGRSTDASDLR